MLDLREQALAEVATDRWQPVLDRFRRGDAAAFTELYVLCRPALLR